MKRKSIFWGITLILIALTLIANQFNYFKDIPILTIIFSALFALYALSSLIKLRFVSFFIPLAIIAEINHRSLAIPSNLWLYLFIGLLLGIGFSLLFKRSRISFKNSIHIDRTYKYSGKHRDSGGFVNGSSTSHTEENISISSSFGSQVRYVRSQNLKHVAIENAFGNLQVYFDEATFSPDGSSIDMDAAFGKVTLYFPNNIRVMHDVDSSFASFNSYGDPGDVVDATVNLRGDSAFGEVEVVYTQKRD